LVSYRIARRYNARRDLYTIDNPQAHEKYQEEWLEFWERRCSELEADGRDPTHYDFQPEWLIVWLRRVQEIMKEEVDEEV